ncbi:type IV secretory system conjugative DNA transfer family protein [Streptomyces celluloflavus]|uniref:type IV secretory system conjugative DNA transfer family protein n=1 Tax=Streptomyces celluloflavus TaxID=58344 RepID=UPI0036A889C8
MAGFGGDPHNGTLGTGGGGEGGFEPVFAVAGLIAAVFALSWVVWLAALVTAGLSGHGWHPETVGAAVPFVWQLVTRHGADIAWSSTAGAGGLGPVALFWALAVVLLVLVLVPAVWLLVRMRARMRPEHGARWARPADEKIMRVPADPLQRPNRLVAGYSAQTRRLLAAEPCASAIAFGPNGSGKTVSLVVPNALEWAGPAVITTAKGPDIDYMLTGRQKVGPVHIVAPVGLPGRETAGWSPVEYATDAEAATRMARWLCEAAAMGDSTNAKPWITQARQLIAPLLLAAHYSGRGIDGFIDYISRWDKAADEVRDVLKTRGDADMVRQYNSVWQLHPDGVGSVKFTANTLIDAYLNSRVRASAATSSFTAKEILDSNGTVFIVAPPSEADALAPLFTALIMSLVYEAERAYEQLNITRPPGQPPQPLDPPLLLDLDEAGNVFRYPDLPRLSSTGRGMGIQLLTIWHDLAQLIGLYGEQGAKTILSQAKIRMVLPSLFDDTTTDYFSKQMGQTFVTRPSRTSSSDGRGSTTMSEREQPLIAPWEITEITAGRAVMRYSNLPPMRVKLRNAETEKGLLALATPDRKELA